MEHLPFLPEELWREIRPIFLNAWPCEAIVAIWKDEWRELQNVHSAPAFGFTIGEADRVELMTRPPLVLLHSHPNNTAEPSDRDTESQLAWGFPWGVVPVDANLDTGHVYGAAYPGCWGKGLPIPPLLGRTYLWAVRDCLTLCQDFYALNGVILPRVPRARDPSIYPKGHWGHDQFLNEPKRLGLKAVKRHERQPGDMFRWQLRANRHNHCGIYLGEGRVLHQPTLKNSELYLCPDDEERFIEHVNAEFFRPKTVKKPLIVDIEQLEAVTPRPLSS